MKIIHSKIKDKKKKKLNEVERSLNDIQELINEHWSVPRNQLSEKRSKRSFLQKILEIILRTKKTLCVCFYPRKP